MVNPEHRFHIADYVIFAITIVVSLGIGLYYALSGGRQRTTSEFLVGNRRMTVIPVAISLMVSFESSIMMLGVPAEVYVYGFQWLLGNIGFFIANMLAIKVMVPIIHPLKITSAYEYLELRFKSRGVRIFGTILGMMSYTCYMGIVLFGPAIALEAVTGFPQWASIIAVAGAAVVYTAIGGLKAVIWTDVFQCVVMFAGFFAVLIKGTIHIGGIGRTWTIASEKGRLNMFNFDPDPTVRHTFWCLFFGSIIRGFGLIFNQSSIQRISSTPTIKDANKVLLLTAPGFFISLTLAGIEGIIAYAYYDTIGCDPLKAKQIFNPNQIIPYMVMDIFKGLQGMPGLFMASLFAASLSTLSSGLSSMSALMWADLVKPHVKPMSELRATIIAKLAVVAFGGVAVFIAFMIALVGGTLIQISGSLLSAFGGPLTGLFMFGAFFPWATAKGAIGGGIISTILTFVIAIGQMTTKGAVRDTRLSPAPINSCPVVNSTTELVYNVTTALYDITTMVPSEMAAMSDPPAPTGIRRIFMLSYQWFGVVGIMGVIVFGSIISFITGHSKPKDVDPRYLVPFYDEVFCCLPERILKVLRCGVDYAKAKKENGNDENYATVTTKEDALHMDIVIAKPPMVPTDNDINTSKNGDIKPLNIKHSLEDLGIPKLNLPNIEYEILSTRQDCDTGDPNDVPKDFIVIDKTRHWRKLLVTDADIDISLDSRSGMVVNETHDESVDERTLMENEITVRNDADVIAVATLPINTTETVTTIPPIALGPKQSNK